jgi:hypothetical protein
MDGKRIALAAMAIAIVVVMLLAGGRLLRGHPGRVFADAVAPIATIRPASDPATRTPMPILSLPRSLRGPPIAKAGDHCSPRRSRR